MASLPSISGLGSRLPMGVMVRGFCLQRVLGPERHSNLTDTMMLRATVPCSGKPLRAGRGDL